MTQPTPITARQWVVCWMYGIAVVHLLVGIALPWLADAAVFDAYHRGIEQHFWARAAPAQARSQQVWWIALFGATLQSTALWMLALVHLGHRLHQRAPWGWLMAGLLVWAPQDILISMQAHAWPHLLVDAAALASMLPPLLWLWNKDGR